MLYSDSVRTRNSRSVLRRTPTPHPSRPHLPSGTGWDGLDRTGSHTRRTGRRTDPAARPEYARPPRSGPSDRSTLLFVRQTTRPVPFCSVNPPFVCLGPGHPRVRVYVCACVGAHPGSLWDGVRLSVNPQSSRGCSPLGLRHIRVSDYDTGHTYSRKRVCERNCT